MLLLVGLGNPGGDYARNRHNIGFMAVDEIVRRHSFQPYRSKFNGELAEDILVIHDELDLEVGKLRLKSGGGHAGHNGLRSIHAHIGEGYRRLRLGIGHPGDKSKVTSHVLKDFAKADQAWLEPLLASTADHIGLALDGDDAGFLNKVAIDTKPKKQSTKEKE